MIFFQRLNKEKLGNIYRYFFKDIQYCVIHNEIIVKNMFKPLDAELLGNIEIYFDGLNSCPMGSKYFSFCMINAIVTDGLVMLEAKVSIAMALT